MAMKSAFQLRASWRDQLPETAVFTVLSNERRRRALAEFRNCSGEITVRELSERLATQESGEDPAPRALRDSVYGTLHQTHLPTLDRHGLVEYDRDRKLVYPLDRTRTIDPYLEVHAVRGWTWVGIFQWLGILGLFLLVGSLGGLPGFRLLPPLLVGSGFLGLFAATSAIRLWRLRGRVRRRVGRSTADELP